MNGRLRGWIAFSPLIYLMHDLEELATVRRFVEANWERLPAPVLNWLGSNADLTHLYAVTIALILVAMAAIAVAAASPRATRSMTTLFAFTVMLRFTNGLLHLGLAIGFRSYVPGLVTALVLVLPYSAWLMSRLMRNWLVQREMVHVLFIGGLLLQLPLIGLALLVAKTMAR